ncbi:MAG TPA: hypothetical protein VG269_15490 [Tepidisphaeraceae bacterium]|jgi:hypothetical protein|nr:hypothetical protein [Tepidisphaeraceae bacterium]
MQNRIPISLKVGDSSFAFRISYKRQQLGDYFVNQLWMPRTTLYQPDVEENSINLVECFWELCLAANGGGTPGHPDERETYLLAHLLPHSLSLLSREVMPDSTFIGPDGPRKVWGDAVKELSARLPKSFPAEDLPLEKFRDLTYGGFGMPKLTGEEVELYEQVCAELLTEPCALMDGDRGRAIELSVGRWNELKQEYYSQRRWKSPQAKRVFSVISYECRTAFHECYSDVWAELLRGDGPPVQGTRGPIWPEDLQITPRDLCFLRLWNLVLKSESNRPEASFHHWRGHVLALHPAGALLIETERGRQVIGNLVSAVLGRGGVPEADELLQTVHRMREFRDLNYALVEASNVYVDHRGETLLRRRNGRVRKLEAVGKGGRAPARKPAGGRGRNEDHATPIEAARYGKKEVTRLFEHYARVKPLTCPGCDECDLVYRGHTKVGAGDGRRARVSFHCTRHDQEVAVVVSWDDLQETGFSEGT